MLAPAPPRCCTRSSTRKDSDTFSIWPSTNCSVNFPGNVIRWSVAMEPVTATGTGRSLGDGVRRDARWTSRDGPNTLGAAGVARRTASNAPLASSRAPAWACEGWGGRGPPSVGQRPPQRRPQLGDADDAEQAADRRPAGDHGRGPAEGGHHPGPAEGEAGHGDPGG